MRDVWRKVLSNCIFSFISSLAAIVIIVIAGTRYNTFAPFLLIPAGILVLISLSSLLSCQGEQAVLDFFLKQQEEYQRPLHNYIQFLKIRKITCFMTLGIAVFFLVAALIFYFINK
ncbi:MAG: hypothetical protein K9L21_04975 [Spirochaetia bacterium]|nr:hypothetical protein [Spirochaetia bacterium]